VQPCTDVIRRGKRACHGFDVGLVVIANNRVRVRPCSLQCAAEEGFSTCPVSFVPQQDVYDLPMVIASAIQVAFLLTPEAEDFIHIPAPSHPSAVAVERLGQPRPKGLHPVEHRTRRDIDVSLRQQLPDLRS
jgi:hypothetical protein